MNGNSFLNQKTFFTITYLNMVQYYKINCFLQIYWFVIYVYVVELNCYTGKGENYRGTHHRTVSGNICVNWQNSPKFKDHHSLGQSNSVSSLVHHCDFIYIFQTIHYLLLQFSFFMFTHVEKVHMYGGYFFLQYSYAVTIITFLVFVLDIC